MAEPATSTAPRPKLLIVDDDHELCSMLAEYLGPEGFLTEAVGSGPAALERLGREAVDLVVLDMMLPELSGFEVLRRIRALNRVPVIMLTARGEEVDRVVGLEMGADDYLAKPFSPRELVARIRAVLRRMSGEGHPTNVPCNGGHCGSTCAHGALMSTSRIWSSRPRSCASWSCWFEQTRRRSRAMS